MDGLLLTPARQKGGICDPPAIPSTPQKQSFAQPRLKSTSPVNDFGDDNLFCKACLKNQLFLTTVLAEYFPSEDDPDYEKYEREYPAYRKDLERRYPQVCQRCAPRAQERLRKTAYAAKVDNLNKSIERSKNVTLSSTKPYTKLALLALNLVTIAWWGSMLLQAAWHTLGLLAIPADPEQVANMKPLMVIGCSINAMRLNYLAPGCSHLFVVEVRNAIQLGLGLIWWNPVLKKRLCSPGYNYQWLGLGDFYRFQVFILVIRAAAWLKLAHSNTHNSGADITRALHGFALLFILVGALASQRMVNYLPVQRVSFRDTTGPLVEPDAFQYPSDSVQDQPSSVPPLRSLRPSPLKPFNIASLGPRRNIDPVHQTSPASPFTAPLTPPPDADLHTANQEDSADTMDWEPLPRQTSPMIRRTYNVNMNNASQQAAPISAIPAFMRPPATANTGEKSPFTGRLPPAPRAPAHKLFNPPHQPQFKPTPLSKQQDFFKQMGLSSAALPVKSTKSPGPGTRSKDDQKIPSEDESEDGSPRKQTYLRTDKAKDPPRPSQWTLKSDLDAAVRGTGTGLEDMFGTSFKLGDDTPTSTPRRNRNNREVGGDGREFIEMATARGAAAAKVVGKELQMMMWPLLLAMLAGMVAIARDPNARQWISDFVAEGLKMMSYHRTQQVGDAQGVAHSDNYT